MAELDSLGNISARFVYGSKGHVPDYMIKNGVTYRYITDHLGSVRLVVNSVSGLVVQQIAYDEFGYVLVNTNAEFQPFGYAGGLLDAHTKLVRFGARDYDAGVGRWTAKDPIGFEGGDVNLFSYCIVDPLNNIDSNGMLFWGLINAGEQWGQEAAEYYARVVADPCASDAAKAGAWVGGLFASLWTPSTSDITLTVLTTAYAWRVIGPYSTRGLPRWLQRIRKYIRFDRPHHDKPGYHWDGNWFK